MGICNSKYEDDDFEPLPLLNIVKLKRLKEIKYNNNSYESYIYEIYLNEYKRLNVIR